MHCHHVDHYNVTIVLFMMLMIVNDHIMIIITGILVFIGDACIYVVLVSVVELELLLLSLSLLTLYITSSFV